MKNWVLCGILAALVAGCVEAGKSGANPSLEADDGAYLDAPYPDLRHPRRNALPRANLVSVFSSSDTSDVIATQTPVKSQESRGTCSIFSATGLLESMLVRRGDLSTDAADLSEEWLEYVVTRGRTTDGSTSYSNFRAFLNHGTVPEALMPYIGQTWTDATWGQAQLRCGKITDELKIKSCLIGHRDPDLFLATDETLLDPTSTLYDEEFATIRSSAKEFRKAYLYGFRGDSWVGSTEEAKRMLRDGTPLTLDIDFYYGAWNHRVAPEIGVERNMDHWNRGIIGYPEPDSVDLARSGEKRAGHSVIIVGYDDNVVVTTDVLMSDGTTKRFEYQGVYYFKNSWGTSSFGNGFQLDGQYLPGYGMITQKYAEEYGAFYALPFATNE